VWAVDPWAEHVDAMNVRGLRVTGLADFVAGVHARTDGSDLPACDFGLVATKAPHTRAAVEGAQAALANAAVVSVQNGLGNEEVIAEIVPRVIRGSIITAGAIVAPGVVRYDAPGDSWFGPFEPGQRR
jgi:2-dehydropantoate 2-reductase